MGKKTLGTCYLACYVPLGTWEVMGAKTDKVKKKRTKGRPREKVVAVFLQ